MDKFKRQIEFEMPFPDGSVIAGTASGELLPAEPLEGILTEDIKDLVIDAKYYHHSDRDTALPVPEHLKRKLEYYVLDELCGVSN